MERNKINQAVRECIQLCNTVTEPVAGIAAFVAGLRASQWDEEEIHLVERAVVRTLGALADTARLRESDTDTQPGNSL